MTTNPPNNPSSGKKYIKIPLTQTC
ncbi:unnamed protein product, partial [Vitis vinifera]